MPIKIKIKSIRNKQFNQGERISKSLLITDSISQNLDPLKANKSHEQKSNINNKELIEKLSDNNCVDNVELQIKSKDSIDNLNDIQQK